MCRSVARLGVGVDDDDGVDAVEFALEFALAVELVAVARSTRAGGRGGFDGVRAKKHKHVWRQRHGRNVCA